MKLTQSKLILSEYQQDGRALAFGVHFGTLQKGTTKCGSLSWNPSWHSLETFIPPMLEWIKEKSGILPQKGILA